MTKNITPPTITETAFDCPHCGAYTTQNWFKVYAKFIDDEGRIPLFPDAESRNHILAARELDEEKKQNLLAWIDKMEAGLVFLENNKQGTYIYNDVNNVHLSLCYNCKKIAIWVHQSIIYPNLKAGISPNQDIPEEIMRDFEEAREILNVSPRGAAALLRLCVQKLCAHLGEKGKNIDDDIASLVAKGLNPLVQKSLDVVRVGIGSEYQEKVNKNNQLLLRQHHPFTGAGQFF